MSNRYSTALPYGADCMIESETREGINVAPLEQCTTAVDGMTHCEPAQLCDYCNEQEVTTDYGACNECAQYHGDNPAGPTLIRDDNGTVIEKDSDEYNFYINQL